MPRHPAGDVTVDGLGRQVADVDGVKVVAEVVDANVELSVGLKAQAQPILLSLQNKSKTCFDSWCG